MSDAPAQSMGGAPLVQVYPDGAALAQAAAAHWVARATEASATRGRFAVALAGGTTPRAAYALLATPAWAGLVDWARVHVFWGDERCVPPDHPESNYRLAHEALLAHVPLPPANVHRVRGEQEPEAAAADYEHTLRHFFGPGSEPRFDLVLLGLGRDGHIASLFPGTAALAETARLVVAVAAAYEERPTWRISLTLPALNAAHEVVFLVSGAEKAAIVRTALGNAEARLPAQLVRPASGRVTWLLDAASSREIHYRRPDPTDRPAVDRLLALRGELRPGAGKVRARKEENR